MRVILENQQLKAEIESLGVELQSLVKKETNQEYMWEADSAYWGKTSPILFPFIGKLEGFQYRYQGKTYQADKHGFARDMDFAIVEQEKDRVVFAIESNEDTLKNYPFPFTMEVEYALKEDKLTEQWRIHNRGTQTMYFSMGAHPAFACPLIKNGVREGKRTDCFVKLYGVGEVKSVPSTEIDVKVGLTSGNTFPVAVDDGVFPIVDHIFDSDALVFAKQGVTAVGFLDADKHEYVRLEAPTCPVWGIWSMPTSDASYVCIEPWWGICDERGYAGTLEERPYINQAKPGETWTDGLTIQVL